MWLDDPDSVAKYTTEDEPTKRGAPPSLVEMMILGWVSGKKKTYHIIYVLKGK